MFKKVLIANRGEIACRIARTLQAMNIAVATVHSTADANALHVLEIGESVCIGEGSARQSYLNIDAVLSAAHQVGADAIHPGFGFLSENSEFARRCAQEGISFIGPSAQTLELFGNKAASKALAQQLGIPIACGMLEGTDNIETVLDALQTIPLPCIVKAVAGGGGKGMRVIRKPEGAREEIEAAIREGRSSFGDGRVIVEQYLSAPRHIEVQILGDGAGNVIHLYDRECSLQRRHQKVVEEAPVSSISSSLREQLWQHAVALGAAVNYLGLGTVEFAITDDAMVFLEVNPRLQVEHPVTEGILGLDLVQLQVHTVAEKALATRQQDVPLPSGHAVQVRLYAEDATQGFMPSTGTIRAFHVGSGIRVDSGVVAGSEISPHYDPMLAKFIAHRPTRVQAIAALRNALLHTSVLGVVSNRSFLMSLLALPQVIDNQVNTETIDHWLKSYGDALEDPIHIAAIMAVWRRSQRPTNPNVAAWGDAALDGWRIQRCATPQADAILHRYQVASAHGKWRVGFGQTTTDGRWPVLIDEQLYLVQPTPHGQNWLVQVNSLSLHLSAACKSDRAWSEIGNTQTAIDIQSLHARSGSGGADLSGKALAPMMGLIVSVNVANGQTVAVGDRLATLESMKMEMAITSAVAGTVQWVGCNAGEKVERNQELFHIAEATA